MQQPSTASESEASHSSTSTFEVTALPRRALLGVVGLVALTVGSLGLAWLRPDMTLLHFVWVAQAVPVLYFLLLWWGMQPLHPNADAA
jgi:hypothetical protein